jgi:FtsP/CotA-like multicopper oxidase with cupredoxin domain
MLLEAVQGPGSSTHERVLDLDVVYTDSRLFNPATGSYDRVHLRSYNGTDVSPTAPYVSPTIEIHPGETIRVNLDNKLPADPSCGAGDHTPDAPHCFNGTNLHTHGLWVNPAGNGDNVLLSINPGVSFDYEYKIPSEHPSGTFWYHTHRHGSTALQVSSGMAGALIVRGNRPPTATANLRTGLNPCSNRLFVRETTSPNCFARCSVLNTLVVRFPIVTRKRGARTRSLLARWRLLL